jgi:acetyl-CoA synthetase
MYLSPTTLPNTRVEELLVMYGSSDASAATLLCDRHDPTSIAYQIINPDLTSEILTYADLRAESEQFAAVLHHMGFRAGDRIATLMGKSRAYLVTLMGIWRLGAVHVPLFTAFASAAISMRLIGSQAKAVVCDRNQLPKVQAGEDIPLDAPWLVICADAAAEDAATGVIRFEDLMSSTVPPIIPAALGADAPIIHIYTSGTTGKPKGVVVPLKAVASFHAYAEFGIGLQPDDIYWCAADPGWAYGLYFGILGSLSTGVQSILLSGGFTPESTYGVLKTYGVTNFAAAPTVYRSLRVSAAPVPAGLKLRCASSAGEPLTPEVNQWAKQAIGVLVADHYGQTEAGMLINNHHHRHLVKPIKPGSMGCAMPGWKAVILEHGKDELAGPGEFGRVAMELAESPFAWFKGYLDDPAKSAEKFAGDGRWYLTGDVARMDDEGYFYFASRDDDVIIMAGYRIGPFDVESVIVTHPSVSECAVIAVPDEVRGEVIEAFVVRRDEELPETELSKQIQQWVKTKYAAHAYPRSVHFVKELPKTPSGKIQRYVLRSQRTEQQRRAEASKSTVAN